MVFSKVTWSKMEKWLNVDVVFHIGRTTGLYRSCISQNSVYSKIFDLKQMLTSLASFIVNADRLKRSSSFFPVFSTLRELKS